MKLSNNKTVCPTEFYKQYWDDRCAIYQLDIIEKYICIECVKSDNPNEEIILVKPNGYRTKRCMVKIEYCLRYYENNNCDLCSP